MTNEVYKPYGGYATCKDETKVEFQSYLSFKDQSILEKYGSLDTYEPIVAIEFEGEEKFWLEESEGN